MQFLFRPVQIAIDLSRFPVGNDQQGFLAGKGLFMQMIELTGTK